MRRVSLVLAILRIDLGLGGLSIGIHCDFFSIQPCFDSLLVCLDVRFVDVCVDLSLFDAVLCIGIHLLFAGFDDSLIGVFGLIDGGFLFVAIAYKNEKGGGDERAWDIFHNFVFLMDATNLLVA